MANTNLNNMKDINNTLKMQKKESKFNNLQNSSPNNGKNPQNNFVSPIMINSPWSEFQTGDNIPEPYNL